MDNYWMIQRTNLMDKRTPVPAYRLLYIQSNQQIVFICSYGSLSNFTFYPSSIFLAERLLELITIFAKSNHCTILLNRSNLHYLFIVFWEMGRSFTIQSKQTYSLDLSWGPQVPWGLIRDPCPGGYLSASLSFAELHTAQSQLVLLIVLFSFSSCLPSLR